MESAVPAILLDCNLRNIEGVIESFGKRKIPLIGLSSVKHPPAFKSRYIRKKLYTPNVRDEAAYLDFLLHMKERGVLVYSDDSSAEFISNNQSVLQENGFLLNIPKIDVFNRAFDKNIVAGECRNANIPTIPSFSVASFEDLKSAWEKTGGRILVKPTRLAGGRYVIVEEEKDLLEAYLKMKELIGSDEFAFKRSGVIAQELITCGYDDVYSCNSYYSSASKPVGFITIRKDRPNINRDGTQGSRLFAGQTIQHETLENYTRKLLDHFQWKGFAHVEWIYADKYKDFLLCEINPRLPGFSNFLTKTGFESAWYYYADLVGMEYNKPGFVKASYFEALRVPGDITNGLYSVFSGFLSLSDFFKPYFRIFDREYKICLEVFYRSDPFFTLAYWIIFLKYFIKRPFRPFINFFSGRAAGNSNNDV